MGKNSLVKAVHAQVNAETGGNLALIEIHREDLETLPRLLTLVRESGALCIIYCDDLSFDYEDTSYKSLKRCLRVALRGGRKTCCSTPPPTAAT